jgi:uncharacterized protein (TIGR03435 family)
MPGYEIIVDKKGPKLKASQSKNDIVIDGHPAPVGVGIWASRTGPQLIGKSATMSQLSDCLSRVLRGPVVDRTGLSGEIDFDVHFAVEGPPNANVVDTTAEPTLRVAIQEQLGLRRSKNSKFKQGAGRCFSH